MHSASECAEMGLEVARSLLAERQAVEAERDRLREALRVARRGLLLAVIDNDEFEWPDRAPDYHQDGLARTQELGQTGEYVSYRTASGDLAVQHAIDAVDAALTLRANEDAA